jgi:hypothetical protein
MSTIRTAVALAAMMFVAAGCGKSTTTGPPMPAAPSTTASSPIGTISVDQDATPSGWVPVAFDDVQISVPATWDVTFGCPETMGNVYLGHGTTSVCPNEAVGLDIVVLGTDDSPPPTGVAPEVINGITAYWLGPDDGTLIVPALHAFVDATGPSAGEVIHTVTYSPRAIAFAHGASPAVPSGWHRVSFGGLSAAVPRSWAIVRRSDGPVTCDPTDLSLSEKGVLLSAGTAVFPPACPDISHLGVPVPTDGLVMNSGPDGPIASDSFGPCVRIHRLRACPATADDSSVLVLAVHAPGRSRPTAVEIGLTGSGTTARTIVDSLRAE